MRALIDALAVLFPVDCAGCGAADRSVCEDCRSHLGAPLVRMLDDLEVRSAAAYEDRVRRLVLAVKEDGRTDVAGALAAAVRPLLPAEALIVPIPGSADALRRRGYDPVLVLARRLRRPVARVLRVSGASVVQKALGERERGENRAGSMVATDRLEGRRVVLLDDVVTSGATLRDGARALREAGAEVVAAVTVASTPRHSMNPQRRS